MRDCSFGRDMNYAIWNESQNFLTASSFPLWSGATSARSFSRECKHHLKVAFFLSLLNFPHESLIRCSLKFLSNETQIFKYFLQAFMLYSILWETIVFAIILIVALLKNSREESSSGYKEQPAINSHMQINIMAPQYSAFRKNRRY